jgi:hypothetical protein
MKVLILFLLIPITATVAGNDDELLNPQEVAKKVGGIFKEVEVETLLDKDSTLKKCKTDNENLMIPTPKNNENYKLLKIVSKNTYLKTLKN